MRKLLLILLLVTLLVSVFSVTVCAVDDPQAEIVTEDIQMPANSLFKAVYGFWSYIYPSEVITAAADTVLELTMYSVAFLVLLPVALVFVCILKLFGAFRGG